MTWHQISIITNKESAPKISDFFSEVGAVSVTYMDAEDQPIYEPNIGETVIWQQTKVMVLFEMEADPVLIKHCLFAKFDASLLQDWFYDVLEDQTWERAWMEHYQPMKFGDSLWVCPTGQEIDEEDTTCLILDPGLAFGTGTHPTTALCLEWLATHDVTDKIMIDYGCGSGILAVAALLLGAKHVYAVDIDPQAITATLDNAEKNQVATRISCYLPEDFKAFQADIVLANILANPLCEMAAKIAGFVKPQGQLILSGILNEQADKVISAYQAHHMMIDLPMIQEDWCRLEAIKV